LSATELAGWLLETDVGTPREITVRRFGLGKGICPNIWYAWQKDLAGAVEELLQRDAVRNAACAKVEQKKRRGNPEAEVTGSKAAAADVCSGEAFFRTGRKLLPQPDIIRFEV